MPSIRLLVVKSAVAECQIDAESLRLHAVDVQCVAWQQSTDISPIECDVVLLETGPELDCLGVIRHIAATAPACKIMVRLRYCSAAAVACLQAGATGILDSVHATDELVEIIRRVCRGDYYLDPDIAQLLAMRQIKQWLAPFTALSSREFDVFCLLAEGCSLKTIAEQFGINSKTVSNCQTAIKLKLALDSRQDIKQFAKYHGLIR